MINRRAYYRKLLFIVLFGLSYSCNHIDKNGPVKTGHKLEVAPIQVDNGWGYDILVDGKVYIHQYCIPAVGGNRVFASKEDALKTGTVVVQKLVKGKIPAITKHDLDSLQIVL